MDDLLVPKMDVLHRQPSGSSFQTQIGPLGDFLLFFYWKRGRAVLCLPVLHLQKKKSNSESLVSEHIFIIRLTQFFCAPDENGRNGAESVTGTSSGEFGNVVQPYK